MVLSHTGTVGNDTVDKSALAASKKSLNYIRNIPQIDHKPDIWHIAFEMITNSLKLKETIPNV